MKKIIVSFFFPLLLNTYTAHANNCNEMLGDYYVIPFSKPMGLPLLSKDTLTAAPLGTPVFKVVEQANKIWHKGLVRGNQYTITLQKPEIKTVSIIDLLVNERVTQCFYQLSNQNIEVIQVDLTKLNEKQQQALFDYLSRTWGNDFLKEADYYKEIKPMIKNTSYQLTPDDLKNIKYFFTHTVREIGVGGYVDIIPLQKTTDNTTFKINNISISNLENAEKDEIEQAQNQIIQGNLEACSACVLSACKNLPFPIEKEQREKLLILSSQTIIKQWSENPQPDQITTLMYAYLTLGKFREKDNQQKAQEYWLKGLSYLQDESITDLSGMRSYTVNGQYHQERAMMFLTTNLLEQLMTINYKLKSCDYPKQIDTYLIPKFSDKDVNQAMSWSCMNKLTSEQNRFFNDELSLSPEESTLFLNPFKEALSLRPIN